MTQDDKDMVYKDILGRAMWGVDCTLYNHFTDDIEYITITVGNIGEVFRMWPISSIRQHLIPFDKMTDEQKLEYEQAKEPKTDYLDKIMVDYRGLISKGYAIDKTEMYI